MIKPKIAVTTPVIRFFLIKSSNINPVKDTTIKKIADTSIIQLQPFPESRPLCKSFQSAITPILISVISYSPLSLSIKA